MLLYENRATWLFDDYNKPSPIIVLRQQIAARYIFIYLNNTSAHGKMGFDF